MDAATKLDRIDINILVQLQKDGRMTNVSLAEAVGLSPSPCLQRVKRLEAAGHVKRARDRADERQVSIFLTEQSRALRGRMECVPDEVGGLTGLDLEGRRALLDILMNLRGALHAGLGEGQAGAGEDQISLGEGRDRSVPSGRDAARRGCRDGGQQRHCHGHPAAGHPAAHGH